MKKNIFFLKGDTVVYNRENYDIDTFIKEFKLPKNIIVYILDEDLFINDYVFTNRIHCREEIDKFIRNTFGNDKDYLFDYKIDWKNKIANIYTIKGGSRLSKICINASDLKVVPLQFEILSYAKRKIKDKSYELVYLHNDSYYFLKVNNNNIKRSVVKDDFDDIKKLISLDEEVSIYIDNKIKGIDYKNIKEIQLGGILDEKILS